jgi:hypothetical protein
MEKAIHKKLTERHNELIKLGKVMAAVKESGLAHKSYNRAIEGIPTVRADTLTRILTAQAKVINSTRLELQAM